VRAAAQAPFKSLGRLLSSHRAITRVSLAALSFTLIAALSQQASTQAGPEPDPLVPASLLPENVGIALASDAEITIPFGIAMDATSVESSLQLLPRQDFLTSWSEDGTTLTVAPQSRWRTDERYVLVLPASVAAEGGEPIGEAKRFSFTTQGAPSVSDFQVRLASADLPDLAPATDAEAAIAMTVDAGVEAETTDTVTHAPTKTATDVSATSAITVSFSAPMDRADVEGHFTITPAVEGDISWDGNDLVFTPSERLNPGGRYTISLIGAHDARGDALGGKANFSFLVRPGAQLTATKPQLSATDVEPATVEMWFSQPMDVDATNEAFALLDSSTGALVGGRLVWNDAATQLTYTPDAPFAGGRTFKVVLGDGARDGEGSPVTVGWSFTTKEAPLAAQQTDRGTTTTRSAPAPAPAPPPPPAVGPVPPASSLVGYALNQINAARAAYGFAPLALDAGITAVATAHAWDQVNNGYYSHTSLNGASLHQRLAAGGVGFSAASENQCHYYGQGAQGTLDWCHSAFMSEPYPGLPNHIANILNPRWTRVGVGIADNGSRVVITWDFTN
jgi:uncharacterized protein YkwD